MTKQKALITRIFSESGTSHPTAEEIFLEARKEMPNVSIGTVYRNLNLMTISGEIRKIAIPNFPDRYDHVFDEHDHIVCIKCGKLFDTEKIEDIKPLSIPYGALLLENQFLFRCICKECNKNE